MMGWPAAGSLRPYCIASAAPTTGTWSGAKTNEGRCGITSANPAARCQLRVKERMLLTPPMSVRAVRRFVMDDLPAREPESV